MTTGSWRKSTLVIRLSSPLIFRDQATHIRTLTTDFRGSSNSMWDLIRLLVRVSWLHNVKSFLSSAITAACRYMYYLCLSWVFDIDHSRLSSLILSSILEFASADYPPWLAFLPAIGLVVTDLVKNSALMHLYLQGNQAFYNVRTALTALIFDKVYRLAYKGRLALSI